MGMHYGVEERDTKQMSGSSEAVNVIGERHEWTLESAVKAALFQMFPTKAWVQADVHDIFSHATGMVVERRLLKRYWAFLIG